MLNQVDAYSVISTARFLAVSNAESSIRSNNKHAYINAELMYDFLTRQIAQDSVWSYLDARIPHDEFPEWPEPSVRPVFSDEEINSWPVVFSDGSTIDDTVDMPF